MGDQDIRSPGRPVSSGLQVPSEPGYCRARTRPPWLNFRSVFPSKCPSVAPAEMSNTPLRKFGPLEDNQWVDAVLIPNNRGEHFSSGFLHSEFLGAE